MTEGKDYRDRQMQEDPEEGELYEHFRFSVDPGQELLRVDKFLTNKIDSVSRNRIQIAADAGCIRVNGSPVKSNYKVKPGDEITVVMDFPRRELRVIPEDIPLNIVYEDNQLLVINKPAGLVVHPGHGNYTGTLVNALAWYLKDLPLFRDNDPRPGVVHRIDKDTSGLLVVAKTEMAKARLGFQFFEKNAQRQYIALVWGPFREPEGTITGNIGRSRKDRQVFTVYEDEEYGKPAVTHYRVVEDLGYVSVVECRLETGRTHQIRVHMKHAGHPVFNDQAYGGNKVLWGTTYAKYRQFVHNCFDILPRQALHAKTLGFTHPETGETMRFDSELPADMLECIDKWRNYVRRSEVKSRNPGKH